jgi:hypothetical protein
MKSKVFFLAFIAIILLSCGGDDMTEVETIGGFQGRTKYQISCIDGVEYIRTIDGITGHFKPDGSLYTCEGEQTK